VLPVPKDSNFRKRRRTSKNKSKQTKEIKLMPPICFLNQIFKLGITQGIEQHWGKLIYMHVAALNASTPVIDNSTLPSSSQKRYQSREKTLKIKRTK